ncbi:Peroxisomal leader peptide-processing protease [Bulinus truncatus]|nr:Peroxisomal leader peptide-processing protease [Bulinus truncatus]
MAMEEILQHIGCVIKFICPAVQYDQSGSGILFDPQEGLILAHGSLLASLCLSEAALASKIYEGQFINDKLLDNCQFKALIDSRWKSCSNVWTSAQEKITDREVSSASLAHTFPNIFSCKCIGAFRNVAFHSVLCKIMPSENWTFDSTLADDTTRNSSFITTDYNIKREESVVESQIAYHLLSYFLIFKMEPVTLPDKDVSAKIHNLRRNIMNDPLCFIGDSAEVIATPFGSQNPSVFFNTYSHGVISNVHGAYDCWIITDARCIPGSEGGPLFTAKKDHAKCLTGMIVASLCWKNKEWVGFSLACSLKSILYSLSVYSNNIGVNFKNLYNVKTYRQHSLNFSLNQKNHLMRNPGQHPTTILASTVLIRVGGTWGSGVIVDKSFGVILTCSHVIRHSQHYPVMVKNIKGSVEHRAVVIFSHSERPQEPFDIAVLLCPKVTSDILSIEVPAIRPPKLGEKVTVVGHALFSSDLELLPSVSSGVISKLINIHGQLVMIQSTCAVHAGTSGGPLLSESGDLVGIMVCNTVDKGSDSSYPHLNMSIPAMNLLSALNHFAKTKNRTMFRTYHLKDPVVKKLWALDSLTLAGDFIQSKL